MNRKYKPKKHMKTKRKICLMLVLLMCIVTVNFQTAQATEERQHEIIRVGFFAMDGYHMMDENGNKSGYGYDFLRMMARYADVEYEYIGYDKSWSDMQKMLEDGEIDMVTSARKTPGREEKFDFSKPIGNSVCMLTVQSDNDAIVAQDYSTYNHMRVALLNGNTRNDDFIEFAEEKGFSYTAVSFDQIPDMEEALQSGDVDAIVSGSLRATDDERVLDTFASEGIYAIVKKGNTELLDKINYAIDQMNNAEGDWKTELYNRYFTTFNEKNLEFTDEEWELIRMYRSPEHTLKILCDPARKPYSYVEDGQMKGILPDCFEKLADSIGILYQFIVCDSREDYLEVQEDTSLYDIAIDVRMDDETAESQHLGITVPYITIKQAKVVRRDFDGEIKTVATVNQAFSREVEEMYAPDARKLVYENRQDAMQAVRDGKADAAFVHYYMAQEFINNDSDGSLVYTMLAEPEFQYRMIITPEHSHALAGIFTKAIYAMPDRTIADIASGYTSYKASDMNLKLLLKLHPMVVANCAVAFMVLFLLLMVLFAMNRKKNRKLKISLQEQQAERRILDKMCMDFTAVYYVDLLSGAFEMFHLNAGTNTEKMNVKLYTHFQEFAEQYALHYLNDENRREFLEWVSAENLMEQLSQNECISYHYRSKPNPAHHEYFEVQAIKINRDEEHFYILVGFRHIDDIMAKEMAVQNQLKQALEEVQLNNEIISAIGKNYFSIYRINVQRDYFEEISNDDETHRVTGNNGCASEKLYRICDTLVQPEYRPLVRPFLNISTLNERLKNEEHIATEYKMCDGNWHRIRFIVKRRDEFGNVTHVLCTVRSISDSKRHEENLLYEAEAAKREADMKTRFLATMSHDIRTPLNGVLGMINMADQYADDPQMQQTIREKTKESIKYLVSLVNDVLDMNNLQSGELQNQELSFDLAEVLREINSIYDGRAAKKKIKYQVMWDKEQISQQFLSGNPVYLARILSNIVDNAIKFSDPGSTISVFTQEERLDNNRVLLTCTCQDQGRGMSEEVARHAFDMFSQGNQTSRSKYEGTGLGLAIVKQLVDRMEGSIELQSKEGSGTTAIVKLPFKISTQDAVDNVVDRAENKGEFSVDGMRALIVEDNELNMEIAKCMLEEQGMEVICAVDGQEGVEIFEKSTPNYFDVIYMDIMMPRMNGLEAAKTIRSMKRKDAGIIPIIATSANAFAEDVINSRLAGMNAHLAKPLDVNKMIHALKKCLADNEEIKLREDL